VTTGDARLSRTDARPCVGRQHQIAIALRPALKELLLGAPAGANRDVAERCDAQVAVTWTL
jgi:hypothetical protein